MNVDEAISVVEQGCMTIAEVAEEAGVSEQTAHDWGNRTRPGGIRYLTKIWIKGKPFVRRSDFDRFKRDHPELIKAQTPAEAPR